MNYRQKLLACAITPASAILPVTASAISYESEEWVESVIIEAPDTRPSPSKSLQRAAGSDTAKLLSDYPGVSLYGAGALSSLPALHGLADDRVRIEVDGMEVVSACPNHMNPPLSLLAPVQVDSIKVMAGITPVSAGGDSLAGTIQIRGAEPEFADDDEHPLRQGRAATFYRSNGDGYGASYAATWASEWLNLSYIGTRAQSDNVHAVAAFKAPGQAAPGREWLAGDVIGSSAYKTENNQLSLALRRAQQLVELIISQQDVPFEQFPTQRMDLAGNRGKQFNLHYRNQFSWGKLDTRMFEQLSSHAMNFGPDRQLQYGTAVGMPMQTEARTRGLSAKADLPLTSTIDLTVGVEAFNYQLNDWWPAATSTVGGMGPDSFQNIHNGRRNRYAAYAETTTRWNQYWTSQLGVRSEIVSMNADPVHGYSNLPMYANDAKAFNAKDHQRSDHHLDLTAVQRFNASDTNSFEIGYAQKNRSPNLYERYTWSASGMSAAMNNFVGDGNGYVGNLDLKPEQAHTLSATWDSHDPSDRQWQLTMTPYITYVTDFIDARRCPPSYSSNCSTANLNAGDAFVILQYTNQNARLFGVDGSGSVNLGSIGKMGDINLSGKIAYTRGENLSTHDNLYNIMPLHTELAVNHKLGKWSNTLEWQLVAAKDNVSAVRNEIRTGGYGLINLRSSYQWSRLRLDVGIDNLLNQYTTPPLGGAYLGQGRSMGLNGIAWGVPVPGLARSVSVAATFRF